MKWFIVSDIHGSSVWCEKALALADREGAERLLLLGDLLYHGPRNDLPEGYAPKEVIAQLNARAKDSLAVRGNCDTEVDQMVLTFPILADYTLLESAGRLIFATHGHHYHLGSLPPLHAGDVLLHGHTHVPAWQEAEGILYLNPGSAAIPKENSPHSAMTLENRLLRWLNLEDGSVYHELRLTQSSPAD